MSVKVVKICYIEIGLGEIYKSLTEVRSF